MRARSDSPPSRRAVLRATLASIAWTASGTFARSHDHVIARLIGEARSAYPDLARRIDFISRAFLGRRYQANTLIGGPQRPEVFVVRDESFDCVTYCETVLAMAKARDLAEFARALRWLRYRNGEVAWRERNHDFAAWCERNVENGACRPVALGTTTEIRKVLNAPPALGRRSYTIAAVNRAELLAQPTQLKSGDIVGFVSRRSALDYYHCGFVAFGGKSELLLRHASLSHRKVVDQQLAAFCTANGVRYASVLRPVESVA